jgi:hypothetical protein
MSVLGDKTIEVLRTNKWVNHAPIVPESQGSIRLAADEVCLLVAVHIASRRLPADSEDFRRRIDAREALLAALARTIHERLGGEPECSPGEARTIVLWNDKHARDVDEVIEVVKLADEGL